METMTTDWSVGVSFPKDATQDPPPRGTLPVPLIRSETGRENIGFDRGDLLELLGAQLTNALPYPCNDSRICVVWGRDPHQPFSKCYLFANLEPGIRNGEAEGHSLMILRVQACLPVSVNLGWLYTQLRCNQLPQDQALSGVGRRT